MRHRRTIGWFLHRYGWRAYALPLLVGLTVVILVQSIRVPATGLAAGIPSPAGQQGASAAADRTGTALSSTPAGSAEIRSPAVNGAVGALHSASPAPSVDTAARSTASSSFPVTATSTAPTSAVPTVSATTSAALTSLAKAPSTEQLSSAPNPIGTFAEQMKSSALPPGGAFTAAGKGTWHVVKGTGKPVGNGPEKYTYTVDVEDGIQSAAADQEFAEAVAGALSDPRSWIGGGKFTLQRVDTGTPSFRVSLTSQMTIRAPSLCGYGTPLETSCYNRSAGRVMINNARWARGAVAFNGDLGLYRVYAINHEVGHALGYGHQFCAENGAMAPVMMQQTFSTSNDVLHELDPAVIAADHKVCRANGYPYPRGSDG